MAIIMNMLKHVQQTANIPMTTSLITACSSNMPCNDEGVSRGI